MNEEMLEHCMMGFVTHRFDVLIATTIIENGLDIPNANTIIVNQAHQFGLAQLYQLRGRVGRSDRRAYAYLLVPPRNTLTSVARKRLAAIREFSELGSGFRIAALDLEIRGAGNLLGGEQSGHINAIGFEMYVKLLESTVRELKGVPVENEIRVAVNIGIDVRIDEDYISDTNQRLSVYRRIASVCSDTELTQLVNELRDRYGSPTASLLNLFEHAKIRMMAEEIGIASIEREKRTLTIKFQSQASLDLGRFAEWVQCRPNVTLVPPGILKVDLQDQSTTQRVEGESLDSMIDSGNGSWWTVRSMTGSLQSRFTHEDNRKPVEVDPLVSGGLFHKIVSLLTELRDSARISYD
jgi:transcription-repair coupling factor (superfamily II helicase)